MEIRLYYFRTPDVHLLKLDAKQRGFKVQTDDGHSWLIR